MVSFDSIIYDNDDAIVGKGDHLDDLFFIMQGSSMLVGTHTDQQGQEVRINVVRLSEGSWYGDFNIFFKQKSQYDLIAKKFKGAQITKLSANKIQVFNIESAKFLAICEDYPEFHSFCMQRANLRYAHFKQVFEENLHYYILNQKLVAQDNEKKFQM